MLSLRVFDPGNDSCRVGGQELLAHWRATPETFLWLDIDGAITPAFEQMLQAEFELNLFALQDAARDRHPPKVEAFDDYTFILYKGLSAESENIDCRTLQIALFVGERFLITRHSAKSPSLERVAKEVESSSAAFSAGPSAIATRFSRLMVGRYLKVLLNFEPQLEELEESLLSGDGESVLMALAQHKSSLIRLQRVFHYQRAVTERLRSGALPCFDDEEMIHALNDVHEQQDRVTSLVALYYQLATDLIDGYISVSSHRLNQIVRVLTIITVIFVPLSFMAGVYGMNFEYMPELRWRPAYFVLLSVMLAVASTLLLVFRWRRWL